MTQYELLYFLLRNKWFIVVGVLVGALGAGATIKLLPKTYRSEAKLLVRYVSDTVLAETENTGQGVLRPGQPSATVIGTEVDILTSKEIAAAAIRALTVPATNSPLVVDPERVRKITKKLGVSSDSNSNTIKLHFDGPTPLDAQRTLAEVIQAYLRKHQEVHRDPGAIEFLTRQTEEMRKRVNDAEAQLRRTKDEAGIVSLADERTLVTMRTQDLDRTIRERESALIATRARLQVLQRQLAAVAAPTPDGASTGVSAVASTPERSDAARQLLELERREAELLGVYTPDSLPVRSLRLQIEALRKIAGARRPTGASTNQPPALLYSRLTQDALLADAAAYQAEEAALVAQLDDLRKRMQAAQAESKRIESWEAQIVRLERTRELYEEQFRHFSQRLENARVDDAVDESKVANIPVVQPPTLPDRPLTDRLKRILALVFVGCAGCGVALGGLREFVLDQSIRHPREVTTLLRVPLLATLPRLRSLNGTPARAFDSACEVVTQKVREQIVDSKETLLVGFTAPHVGAGVTSLAGRVAEGLRLSGVRNVLLAGVASDGQISGRLIGSIVTHADVEEMSEPSPSDPATPTQAVETIGHAVRLPHFSPGAITQSLLDEFSRRDYDCVLFDLPPMGESDVTMRLLPRLHGVVLALGTLETTRTQALDCMRQFEQLRCSVYGAVLNKFRTPVPAWLMPPSFTRVEEQPEAEA